MAAILGDTKIFENWEGYSAEILCGSKNLLKLLYLAREGYSAEILCGSKIC